MAYFFPVVIPRLHKPAPPRPPYRGGCCCACKREIPRMSLAAGLAKLQECLCPCHERGGPHGPGRRQRHEEIEQFHLPPWWRRLFRGRQ